MAAAMVSGRRSVAAMRAEGGRDGHALLDIVRIEARRRRVVPDFRGLCGRGAGRAAGEQFVGAPHLADEEFRLMALRRFDRIQPALHTEDREGQDAPQSADDDDRAEQREAGPTEVRKRIAENGSSEKRRVGKECVSPGRLRWSAKREKRKT